MRLRTLIFSAVGAALLAGTAFADPAKEEFVRENGQRVLNSLNDEMLDTDARTETFAAYMEEFTDINSVARFVIGKYARRFTPEELSTFENTFRRYALAVYEVRLDEYRGEELNVTGSTNRSPDDAVVESIIRRGDGRAMRVLWRVMNRDGEMQVVDVALDIDGNLIWLAIEQRAQLLSVLDRTNGSADAVIAKLDEMTAKLEREKRAAITPVTGRG